MTANLKGPPVEELNLTVQDAHRREAMTIIDDAVKAVFASGVLSSCEREGDTAVIGCNCYDEIDYINVRELVKVVIMSVAEVDP
jgi:hypothetical protein